MVKSLIVRDTAHRPLSLSVTTELVGRGSLQVYIHSSIFHLSIHYICRYQYGVHIGLLIELVYH